MARLELTVEVARDSRASLGGPEQWIWRAVDTQGAVQVRSDAYDWFATREAAMSAGESALQLIEAIEQEWEEKTWRDA